MDNATARLIAMVLGGILSAGIAIDHVWRKHDHENGFLFMLMAAFFFLVPALVFVYQHFHW